MSVRMPKFHAPAQLTRTAKAARSPLVQGCVSCAYALHSKASLQAARAYVQTSWAHVIVTYTVHSIGRLQEIALLGRGKGDLK